MVETRTEDGSVVKNLGWRVAMAGVGINLALGILYTWSIISSRIDSAGWGWTQSQRSLPYSVACFVFCLIMVPAGRMQDKLGPRLVASIGGVLVGLGMIVASLTQSVGGYVFGFGVLAGAGIGFGYASATPPAVKWFPPAKTGLIAGIVVSGFGLASVYAAPLADYLAASFGLQSMMMIFGIAFLVVVVGLAQFLKAPHKALQFSKGFGQVGAMKAAVDAHEKKTEIGPFAMLRTWQFYVLWFMYACGAGAGLMIISVAKKINGAAGVGVAAVVGLAIGNGGGRILAGVVSDKIGRQRTMLISFLIQAGVILSLSVVAGTANPLPWVMVTLSVLVGINYGSNLSLFPSVTKDYFGLKNFGINYGLLFTAWGIGGLTLAQLAASKYDQTKSFSFAFYCSTALLVIAGAMTFIVRPLRVEEESDVKAPVAAAPEAEPELAKAQ